MPQRSVDANQASPGKRKAAPLMATVTTPKVDLEKFNRDGYLIVEGIFDPAEDLDPVVAEYTDLLERLTDEFLASGRISRDYRELPFAQRLAGFLQEAGPTAFQHFDISLPFNGVTEATPIHTGPQVFGLLRNRRLLDVIEQFIGGEILSNPIQHVRIKPPSRLLGKEFRNTLVGQTDWHQDQGVALPEMDETDVLTCWMPIFDATVENGCLCAVPGSHKQGLATHCPGTSEDRKGLHIPDEIRGDTWVPLPIPRGGALFLHRRTMHASLDNASDGIRWSYDLRYQPVGQPTGRPWFPAFVARSRSAPDTELTDWTVWGAKWLEARTLLAEHTGGKIKTNRWTGEEAVCAA